MKAFRKTLLAVCLGAAAMGSMATIASEAKNVMISVNKTNNSDAVVDVKIDGNTDVFNIPELQVGESHTFTSDSGNDIVATKTEEGLAISINGEELKLPMIGKLGAKLHKSMPLHKATSEAIDISGVELDETQQQIIRDAFAAAGINKKVNFNKHKVMVLSTDSLELGDKSTALEWISKNGEGNFDVIVKGIEGDHAKVLHKVIELKEVKKDDN